VSEDNSKFSSNDFSSICGRNERQKDFILTLFTIVGREEEFCTPIIGCLFFLRDCDEVLKVSLLAFVLLMAVKPTTTTAAAAATLFPFIMVSSTHYIPVSHKISTNLVILGQRDTAS
jgi:hypothetical protein